MNNHKIILAEDDFDLRELYLYALRKAGYLVISAEDGEQALQACQSNPDATLVLLDVMMPKMHGVDVLKQVKANPLTKALRVLMLSNLSEENVIEEALKIGALGYLIKARTTPQKIVEEVGKLIA